MKELYSFQRLNGLFNTIGRFGRITLMFLLITLFSFQMVQAQIVITKEITKVASSVSGSKGHIDVTYQVSVTNNSLGQMPTFLLTDDISDISNMGTAFIGLSSSPSLISAPAGYNSNFGYDGMGDILLVTQSTPGLLGGQTLTVEYTVELKPLATGAPSILKNTADINGSDQASTSLPDCWKDCVIACNSLVNIAANSKCETDILSEMILEGEDEECTRLGFFKVQLTDNDGNVVAIPVTKDYIGKVLNVTVTNIVCNNSCWGKVLIEDKTPPKLVCNDTLIRCNQSIDPINLGFPVPIGMIDDPNNGPDYIANGIDACGSVELYYVDSIIDNKCLSDTSNVIYRKWSAKDISGYEAVCWDTIYLVRGTLSDINLPLHYDGVGGHKPALECNGNWTKLANGFPDTTSTGTGAPSGILCGKIQFFYQDDTIKICESSYKLLRRWVIVDWCNPQDRMEYIQQIKVVDHDGPVVVCPTSIFNLGMNNWQCGRDSWDIPVPVFDPTGSTANAAGIDHPIIFEECGSWTYEVRHIASIDAGVGTNDCSPELGRGNMDHIQWRGTDPVTGLPLYKLVDVPQGCNWIYYDIIDDCGNVTECRFDIFIEDDLNPVPVCHQHTVVSLSSEKGGSIKVPASVFDDGSHDNCMLDTMLVRRGSRGVLKGYIEFNCNDVGREIDVELHVFDKNGNSSHCKVKVTVQDKIPPVITECPDDVFVDCGRDLSDLSVFGSVKYDDNCSAIITVTPKDGRPFLNDCGLGTIIRTFTVTDGGGLTATCQQKITVVDRTPFSKKDIIFPVDTTVINVCMGDISPDVMGKPIYLNLDDCNQIAASYEDKVFSYVDNACFKIIRYWSILDWCTYDAKTGAGKWDTVQVIKVLNDIAPVITSACADVTVGIKEDKCTADFVLRAAGTDDCTPVSKLKWSYDFVNNSGKHFSGTRSRASFLNMATGTHHITWTLEDQCGNKSSCEYDIIVKDAKKPTPYCRNGLTTVLMPSTGEIAIWASDFNIGSFDNCTDDTDLKIAFSSNVNDTGRVYTCADLDNGISDTFEVQIWVIDAAGNKDYCTTHVIIQDNQDVCPDKNVVSTGAISGIIATNSNQMMDAAEVQLENMSTNGMIMNQTNDFGKFAFHPLTMHKDYRLTVKYDVDYLNGVTTRDLVAIQKHLLGIKEIESPYKLIAADANNSSSVSTRDISQIRKLILGKIVEFPKVDSWRFVDSEYQFADKNDPFPFEESIVIHNLSKDEDANHFIAIKIGDVTGDVKINGVSGMGTRTNEIATWKVAQQHYSPNQLIEVPVFATDEMSIEGFQMTIELPSNLELINVKSGIINLNENNLGLLNLHNNRMAVSYDNVIGVQCTTTEALFTLIFKSHATGDLDELITSSLIAKSEVYLQNGEMMELRINEENMVNTTDKFELYQNTPNPFNDFTTIGFNLPTRSQVTLSIFDMSGKTLKSYKTTKEKGYNTIDVDINDLDVSGVLYYKLESDVHSATRKMVIIK